MSNSSSGIVAKCEFVWPTCDTTIVAGFARVVCHLLSYSLFRATLKREKWPEPKFVSHSVDYQCQG